MFFTPLKIRKIFLLSDVHSTLENGYFTPKLENLLETLLRPSLESLSVGVLKLESCVYKKVETSLFCLVGRSDSQSTGTSILSFFELGSKSEISGESPNLGSCSCY